MKQSLRTLPYSGGEIDLLRLRDALGELSRAFVAGEQGSYGMRIPAEPYRDGDLVCGRAMMVIDKLIERHDELTAALRSLSDLYELPGEDNIDRFDRVAAMFHRETGCYAPGKDVAAAANDSTSYEERRERFEAWYAERAAKARAALAKAGVT